MLSFRFSHFPFFASATPAHNWLGLREWLMLTGIWNYWRVDHCSLSSSASRAEPRALPCTRRTNLNYHLSTDIVGNILLAFRAKSTHEIDDNGDQQNQANTAAADERTSKVEPAGAEQKKKNK